jgi:hypothetical protein
MHLGRFGKSKSANYLAHRLAVALEETALPRSVRIVELLHPHSQTVSDFVVHLHSRECAVLPPHPAHLGDFGVGLQAVVAAHDEVVIALLLALDTAEEHLLTALRNTDLGDELYQAMAGDIGEHGLIGQA